MHNCVATASTEALTPVLEQEGVPPTRSETCEQRVRVRMNQILGKRGEPLPALERRQDVRKPFPYLLNLTPVDRQGKPIPELTTVVVGKNLAERGIDFFHSEPIPYRRVIITLEAEEGNPVHLLTDLHWCRFTKHGWYDNGGRFLDVVSAMPSTPPLSD
ncbi:MAG: hypothetical protein WD045_02110 [Pirellulaceae bacterium]